MYTTSRKSLVVRKPYFQGQGILKQMMKMKQVVMEVVITMTRKQRKGNMAPGLELPFICFWMPEILYSRVLLPRQEICSNFLKS